MYPNGNIFSFEKPKTELEGFFTLLKSDAVHIELIVSNPFQLPNNEWMIQKTDEWVLLLEGKATLEFETEGTKVMTKGDFLFIPAETRHRVVQTSDEPNCIWLAVHGSFSI